MIDIADNLSRQPFQGFTQSHSQTLGAIFLIIDPTEHELEKLKYVRRLCQSLGIKLWYINEELEKAHKKK
jgi:hypothetical protein